MKVNNKLTSTINENIMQKWGFHQLWAKMINIPREKDLKCVCLCVKIYELSFQVRVGRLRSCSARTFHRQNYRLVLRRLKLISVTENGQVSKRKVSQWERWFSAKIQGAKCNRDDVSPSLWFTVSTVGDEERSARVLCIKTLGGDGVKTNKGERLYAAVSLTRCHESFCCEKLN